MSDKILEDHELRIAALERAIVDNKEMQKEIKLMNETLITLTSEMKHNNEHLARHERKIDEIERQPKQRLQQIITAIIAALAGVLVSLILSKLN